MDYGQGHLCMRVTSESTVERVANQIMYIEREHDGICLTMGEEQRVSTRIIDWAAQKA